VLCCVPLRQDTVAIGLAAAAAGTASTNCTTAVPAIMK
jgi:hypothetical protein